MCYMLRAACCVLRAACCVLRVACCVLYGVWCMNEVSFEVNGGTHTWGRCTLLQGGDDTHHTHGLSDPSRHPHLPSPLSFFPSLFLFSLLIQSAIK